MFQHLRDKVVEKRLMVDLFKYCLDLNGSVMNRVRDREEG